MKVNRWPDGSSLVTDPRGEDPVFYYLHEDDWQTAIGFAISPLFDHAKATEVVIAVSSQNRDRLAGSSPSERLTIYLRVIETLMTRFKSWNKVTVDIDDTVLYEPELTFAIARQGWERVANPPAPLSFART